MPNVMRSSRVFPSRRPSGDPVRPRILEDTIVSTKHLTHADPRLCPNRKAASLVVFHAHIHQSILLEYRKAGTGTKYEYFVLIYIILFPSDTGRLEQGEDQVHECRTIGQHLTCATKTGQKYGDAVAHVCRGTIFFLESSNSTPV